MPWWGAVLIAVTATAIGFAYDAGSGDKELSNVFAALYVIGCITAVLAVRRSGLFTAVVQPSLILFVAVPTAYWLFHGGHVGGLKDLLINCGYPLIERFLLMLLTSVMVLVIGVGRWWYGASKRSAVDADDEAKPAASRLNSLGESITSKMADILSPDTDEDDAAPRRRHAIDRPTTATAPAKAAPRTAKTAKRAETTRSRHVRPPAAEIIDPVAEQPRRQRATPRETEPAEPRRRRTSTARESLRNPPPREPRERRDPYERRDAYERRVPHDRRSSPDESDPFEAYEPPQRRRPGVNGSYSNNTHHPISRVRYRGTVEDADEPLGRRASGDEGRAEYRSRPRSRSRLQEEAESWEYDI